MLLIVAILALVSCGRGTPAELGGPPTTNAMNDPALTTAADKVIPVLEQRFAHSYAGILMRSEVPEMVIYRKPDRELDAEVRRLVPDVRVRIEDADHTLVEMKKVVTAIFDDPEHWKGKGLTVHSAGPDVDGSGVNVTTSTDVGVLEDALKARFPDMSFNVEKGSEIVPVPMTIGPR